MTPKEATCLQLGLSSSLSTRVNRNCVSYRFLFADQLCLPIIETKMKGYFSETLHTFRTPPVEFNLTF